MWSVNDEHRNFAGNLSKWILNKITALYKADFSQKPYTAGFWQVSSAPSLTDHMVYTSPAHSMARANQNKSENLMTNTTAASKYKSRRPRIYINWNSPFQTNMYIVKVPVDVKIVKKDLLHENSFWYIYEVRFERGDFNWCWFWAS